MSYVDDEIHSQPDCWAQAGNLLESVRHVLPVPGERVAVVGCGTSWFMAQAYAARREAASGGETDAFAASEAPLRRRYDRLVVITRSGTTTEVLGLLQRVARRMPTVALTAVANAPVATAADDVIALEFADERSVVQTRFATSALALLRASLGEDLQPAISDGQAALAAELPEDVVQAEQVTFLGTGWTVGLAHEAALKTREAAGGWTESYPAMEYRHGPISITGPGRVTWIFGEPPAGLAEDVAATGGRLESSRLDPMADLVRAQRVAVGMATARGLDADNPRHLSRSVILADNR
jgi:fructoselysine-6-P-deglycase FrlB-like protein